MESGVGRFFAATFGTGGSETGGAFGILSYAKYRAMPASRIDPKGLVRIVLSLIAAKGANECVPQHVCQRRGSIHDTVATEIGLKWLWIRYVRYVAVILLISYINNSTIASSGNEKSIVVEGLNGLG